MPTTLGTFPEDQPNRTSKDRYFKSRADLPDAKTFGPGQAQIGNSELVLSDGDSYSAIGKDPKNTAIFIGTSISNQRFATSGLGTDVGASWIYAMEMILGHPFTALIDAAVSGRTIAEMVSNWSTDVAPFYDQFDWAFIEPGPNSANAGISGITDVQWMIDTLIARGKKVIVLTNTGVSALLATGTTRTAAAELANFIRNYVPTVRNCYLADVSAAVLEGTSDGLNNAVMFNQGGDLGARVHPTTGGHSVMGKTVAAAIPFLKKNPIRALNRYNHLEYFPNPSLFGGVASGVRNAQIAAALNTTASTLPECVGVGMSTGATFSSVATTALITKALNSDGANVLRIEASGAGADWHRINIRFGSTDATNSIPAQVGRWDIPWATGLTGKTIGDHLRHSGSTTGIFTLVALSAGDSYTTGAQPALPTTYGSLVTDGVATWMWQKLPSTGDVFQAEIPYKITSLTGGVALGASLIMGLQNNLAGGFLKGYSEFPVLSYEAGSPPTKYFPRDGVLKSPKCPLITATGNDTLRHVWCDLIIAFSAGSGAVIEIPSASIIRIV